jgi:hypothetical protein
MPPSTSRNRDKKSRSKKLGITGTPLSEGYRELFQWYGVPPSSLHEALQTAARQEGWLPPWEHQVQKQEAGKTSGTSRAGLAAIRRLLVNVARSHLSPDLRRVPYSEKALDALRTQYDRVLLKGQDDADPIISGIQSALSERDRATLKRVSRDTLIKDLKEIRRRRLNAR